MRDRVLKNVRGGHFDLTLAEIEKSLKDKSCLVVIVMDEAHFAATSVTISGNVSPYGRLVDLLTKQ